MTSSEIKSALTAVVNTLNTVSVRGKDDLNHMLATISMLERIAREVDTILVSSSDSDSNRNE